MSSVLAHPSSLCSVWALEAVSRGLCPVHWSWKKSVLCLVMEQDVSASQEWWEVVWVSRDMDHPLQATSSEEVKAAFMLLLTAACLVIIPLYMSRAFQEKSQQNSNQPMEECATHRQQRLTSHSATQMPDSRRRSKYMKPALVWRGSDEQICSFCCSAYDTCRADIYWNTCKTVTVSNSTFIFIYLVLTLIQWWKKYSAVKT